MAILHQAQIKPSKLELLADWLPTQSWFAGEADAEFVNVAAYRFDDPEGEVGVETILVRAGTGPTMHVPLTYRAAPLDGAEGSLICTMEHSVLGKRWVYDGVGDPVYLQTVATAALSGGHQVALEVAMADGSHVVREPNALVSGTGTGDVAVELPSAQDIVVNDNGDETVSTVGPLTVRVRRVLGQDAAFGAESASGSGGSTGALVGSWAESDGKQELAFVRTSLSS